MFSIPSNWTNKRPYRRPRFNQYSPPHSCLYVGPQSILQKNDPVVDAAQHQHCCQSLNIVVQIDWMQLLEGNVIAPRLDDVDDDDDDEQIESTLSTQRRLPFMATKCHYGTFHGGKRQRDTVGHLCYKALTTTMTTTKLTITISVDSWSNHFLTSKKRWIGPPPPPPSTFLLYTYSV